MIKETQLARNFIKRYPKPSISLIMMKLKFTKVMATKFLETIKDVSEVETIKPKWF